METIELGLLAELDRMLVEPTGATTAIGTLVADALAEICKSSPSTFTPTATDFWASHVTTNASLSSFFADWLGRHPASANPGYFLDFWDAFTRTDSGGRLTTRDPMFASWFERFLDLLCGSAHVVETWLPFELSVAPPNSSN